MVLDSVENPKQVRDILARYANARRSEMLEYQHTKEVHKRQAGATAIHFPGAGVPAPEAAATPTPTPTPTPGKSLAEELRELAELRDAGILTNEEFAAQKARILDSH